MKSSTKFIVTLVCLCCSFGFATIGSAQTDVDEEVIVLMKDRSIYRGYLVEDAEDFIKIQIQTNDTLYIPIEKVRKIRYGEDFLFHDNGKSHKITGYFWWLTFGIGSSTNGRATSSAVGELIVGKRINSRFAAGIAIGLNATSFTIEGSFADPAFASIGAHGRYYIANKKTRIFLYSQIGYGTKLPSYLSGETGKLFNVQNGFGLHFPSRNFRRIFVSLAHNLQYLKGTTRIWGFNNINTLNSSFEFRQYNFWSIGFSLKAGFDF